MFGPIERAVQMNIALIIAQAVVIRLSLEIQNPDESEPDVLVLLGFLASCAVAAAIVVVLYRVIRIFPRRTWVILAAVMSFAIQAAAFQLLFNYAS